MSVLLSAASFSAFSWLLSVYYIFLNHCIREVSQCVWTTTLRSTVDQELKLSSTHLVLSWLGWLSDGAPIKQFDPRMKTQLLANTFWLFWTVPEKYSVSVPTHTYFENHVLD